MTYSDKLKNPKWQRKRLEILKRDKWKCCLCGNKEKTLHIHHKKYTTPEIWNEKKENLQTLCELCHSFVEYLKKLKIEIPDKIQIIEGALKYQSVIISYYDTGITIHTFYTNDFSFRIGIHKKALKLFMNECKKMFK